MVTFIETTLFTRLLPDYLDDQSYRRLQEHLAQHPDAGPVVRGSGGVRKLRWAIPGRGKSGGLRVIYFANTKESEVWMLTLYAKGEEAVIPAHVLKQIREEIRGQR